MSDDFASWLKRAREDAELSQRQIGEMVGVSTAAVSRWEARLRTPTPSTRLLLERTLPALKRSKMAVAVVNGKRK